MAALSNLSPIMANLYAGYQLGSDFAEGVQKRRAASSLADMYAGQKGWDPSQAAGGEQAPAPAPVPAEPGAAPAPEGPNPMEGMAQRARGDKNLPSTRDWVNLRTAALRDAAATGDMDAVKQVNDQIDAMQKKGFVESLMISRELAQRGDTKRAAEFLERAASFKPDFNVLMAGEATMKDGTKMVTAAALDEQTHQPKTPALFMTPEMYDRLLFMATEGDEFGKGNFDRQMAEKELGLKERTFVAGRGDEMARRAQARVEEAGKMKRAEMAAGKPMQVKRSDYFSMLDKALEDMDTESTMASGKPLSAAMKQEARKKMEDVLKYKPGLAPATAMRIIIDSMSAKPVEM